MYEYCDHIKCIHCQRSNCLFKLRVNQWQKKMTGNIIYVTTRECKPCFLERCQMKNDRYYGEKKNRDKVNAAQRLVRKGNPHYQEAHRISWDKNKDKYNAQRRKAYKSRRKTVRIGNTSKFSRKRRTVYGKVPQDHPGRKFNFQNKELIK